MGGTRDVELHCRVIAATNRDLEQEVRAGRFREDLFFRLNVIQIGLPPLRERREDIPRLADAFVAKFAEEQASAIEGISDEAMRVLTHYTWPGNVRELETVIERGVTLGSGPLLGVEELPATLRDSRLAVTSVPVSLPIALPETGIDLEATLEGIERQLLEEALARTAGRKKKAAELLRLSFRSFRYRVAKLGLDAAED